MARKNRSEEDLMDLSDPDDVREELDPVHDLNRELVITGEHSFERDLVSPCDRPTKVGGMPVLSDKFRRDPHLDECHNCVTPDGLEDAD